MTSILNNLRTKDEISQINYEELEKRFNIHKYYPKYFHNEEVTTPMIKSLISDKPIYSKANEHLAGFVNPGVMKIYETELDLASGKLRIRKENEDSKSRREMRQDAKQEAREARQEAREARHDALQARLEAHREVKEERRQERHERRLERRGSKDLNASFGALDLDDRTAAKKAAKKLKIEAKRHLEYRKKLIESKEKPRYVQFRNPFDNQDSLSIYNNYQHEYEDDSASMRKNSITSRLRSFISNNSDELQLERTNSFDQTKSVMTTGRKKTRLFKKRYSEQIGTYKH